MNVLALRTDKPEAELYLYSSGECVAQEIWSAHKELSSTILIKLTELLSSKKLAISDVTAVVCFVDGGSFTGLRIGVAVANALAAGLQIPVIPAYGTDWLQVAKNYQQSNSAIKQRFIEPKYDMPAAITPPKK